MRRPGRFFRRVEKRHVTAAGPGRSHRPWNTRIARHIAIRHRQHAKAFGAERLVFGSQIVENDLLHRRHFAVQLKLRTTPVNFLGRSFGQDADFALSALRTTTDIIRRTKSNGISSTFSYPADGELAVIENRPVEDIAKASLEMTDEIRLEQDFFIILCMTSQCFSRTT